MLITPTYPGVSVEEIPSGVHTITGMATSIMALIGRANCGPTDKYVKINGFADIERTPEGLWFENPMSFVVRDFFVNGGSGAIVVRLCHADGQAANSKAKIAADRNAAAVFVQPVGIIAEPANLCRS